MKALIAICAAVAILAIGLSWSNNKKAERIRAEQAATERAERTRLAAEAKALAEENMRLKLEAERKEQPVVASSGGQDACRQAIEEVKRAGDTLRLAYETKPVPAGADHRQALLELAPERMALAQAKSYQQMVCR